MARVPLDQAVSASTSSTHALRWPRALSDGGPPSVTPASPRRAGSAAARRETAKRLPVDVLSREEALTLLDEPSTAGMIGPRDRALLAVLYHSGLRCGEVLALRLHDIDLGADPPAVRVQAGKGGRRRVVGIRKHAAPAISRWPEVRAARGLDRGAPLFCSLRGRPLQPSHVRRLLPRLARAAGIEKRVHAHGLRRAFATELRHAGVDVQAIQNQLGHEHLATTVQYLDRITPDSLLRTIWAVP